MGGTGGRRGTRTRAGRALGNVIAVIVTLAVAAAGAYGMVNFEELKGQVYSFDAAVDEETALRQAADDAVGFAEQYARPPESNGVGKGYRFSAPAPTGIDADPGHWCGGTVIGYRIDFTGAVRAGSDRDKEIERWRSAFAQWTAASGGRYQFEYRGEADYPLVDARTQTYPIDPELVPDGEIAISYGVPPEIDEPQWQGYRHPGLTETLGFAGLGPIEWSSGPGQSRVTKAMIVMDALDSQADPRRVPTPYPHEAGHALGLSHVPDPGQLMYDTAGATTEMNDGDRAGITRLAMLPCN